MAVGEKKPLQLELITFIILQEILLGKTSGIIWRNLCAIITGPAIKQIEPGTKDPVQRVAESSGS